MFHGERVMKDLKKVIAASGILLFSFLFFISCIVEPVTIVGFEIDDSMVKREWFQNEELNVPEVKVKAIYSDGTEKFLKESDFFIYPENGTLCGSMPHCGYPENFDKGSSYGYGSEIYILSNNIETNWINSDPRSYILKVIPVIIIYDKVVGLEVDTSNVKLDYGINEKFDFTGLKVKATYADGHTADVAIENCNISYPSTMCDGTFPVTVNYEDRSSGNYSYVSAVFYINVLPVEYLEVDYSAVKTSYFSGEYFNSDGLKVYAVYTNGEKRELNSYEYRVTISSFMTGDAIQNGENDVYIYFAYNENIQAKFTVHGEPVTVVELKLDTSSVKTSYYEGDNLNLNNLGVTVVYNNGTEYPVGSAEYTVYMNNNQILPYDTILNTPGEQEITVVYRDKSSKFTVSVTPLVLERIELNTDNVKKSYFINEYLQLSNLKVYAVYNSGRKQIYNYSTSVNSYSILTTAGEQKITVSFGGKTASFAISVSEVTVSELELVRDQLITSGYYVGDSPYKYSGLVVKAHFNNGEIKELGYYTDYEISPSIFSTVGENTVTITYGGKQVSYTVNVEEEVFSHIRVSPPWKTNYYTGDQLDLSGFYVTAVYNSGDKWVGDYTIDIADGTILDTAGKKEITVSYGGKTSTFEISVAELLVTDLKLDTQRVKTDGYYTGDKLNLRGLYVIAYYNSGKNKEIKDYTTNIPEGAELVSAGNNEIIVSYGGKTALFTVEVKERILNSIWLDTSNLKREGYYVGDKLDLSGLRVNASYNNGNAEVSNYTTSIADGGTLDTAGEQEIIVSFGGKTKSFIVYVTEVEIARLEADTSAVKTEGYYSGDTLDLSGLRVFAHYNNGDVIEVEDYTIYYDDYSLKWGRNFDVRVSYGTKTTSFDIHVTKLKVVSLELDTTNVKTKGYYTGDTLDLSGLRVTALYNNGDKKEVTGYSTYGTNGEILRDAGLRKIEVYYDQGYADFEISITQLEITALELDTSALKPNTVDDGLVVTAVYNNGNSKIVEKYQISTKNNDPLTKGGYWTVTVKYVESNLYINQEIEASYDVLLDCLERIELDTSKVKKSGYYVGDKVTLKDIKVTEVYTSGKTNDITYGVLKINGEIEDSAAGDASYSVYPRYLDTAGKTEIKISHRYNSSLYTASFYVDVEPVVPVGLSVSTSYLGTKFYTGDILNLSKLGIALRNNNGTYTSISYLDCDISIEDKTVLNTVGEQTITVSYGGYTQSFVINVVELKLQKITSNKDNVKTDYIAGERFTLDGLVMNAIYNNGKTVSVPISDLRSTIPEGTVLVGGGNRLIEVWFQNKGLAYYINVREVIGSVKVTVPSYSDINDLLSYDGGVFTALDGYNNYVWILDDNIISETSNSFIPIQSELKPGNHEIMVLVTNSKGKKYSASATFTVVR